MYSKAITSNVKITSLTFKEYFNPYRLSKESSIILCYVGTLYSAIIEDYT